MLVDTRAISHGIIIQYTSVICVDGKPQCDICCSLFSDSPWIMPLLKVHLTTENLMNLLCA